ncbi:HTTM domain-containing protein [Streptomyces ficellus]|uniref:HTTM domain-containing protein n=1 Tax=Streptomyces ficellus TaxID=1977088 RepID=A0ABT7ZE08_9ACTN|nr:HTTM domain-containing protein [Streptomyces ficellus]MDN3297737.1 HTTM domain-containing protein [Streptomyces ficellus]
MITSLRARLRASKSRSLTSIDQFGSTPFAVLGVSGTRALLGFVGFMFYVSQYADRHYLFGPSGVESWSRFLTILEETDTYSLYAVSTSTAWFEFLFHLGMLLALAVTLGVGGRPVLALHGVFLWSVYQRDQFLLDGGDNLAYLVIPMLLLTRCYDRLSLTSGLAERVKDRLPGGLRATQNPLHNLGVLAIAVQICLVYVTSGLYKVQGKLWQDGTALFYIMRIPEFELPGWSRLVYDNDLLVIGGTYATTLFLVYFPLGVLVPKLRPWAALASIGFHLSIAFFMGLTGFALTMVACDLIFLSRPLGAGVRLAYRLRERVGSLAGQRAGWPKQPAVTAARTASAENAG